jgi:hypothetical protein
MTTETDSPSREGRLLAVIVGVGGYGGKMKLAAAANDALLLAQALEDGWPQERRDVTALVWPSFAGEAGEDTSDPFQTPAAYTKAWGRQPPVDARHVTKDAILATVERKAAEASEEDSLLVYLAGHGEAVAQGACFLAIADGESGNGTERLPLWEITERTTRCRCRNKVMILDCCLTNKDAEIEATMTGIPISLKSKMDFFDSILSRATEDWYVLLSCSPGQESLEDHMDGRCQGLFTAALVQGLRGQARREAGAPIGLLELANYVHHRVRSERAIVERCKPNSTRSADQESLGRWIAERGLPSMARGGAGLEGQHPVLLARRSVLGGYFDVTLMPSPRGRRQDLRRTSPSPRFWRLFAAYLFGPWPVLLSRRRMFRTGGALLYALTLMLTMLWFGAIAGQPDRWLFAGGWGVAAAMLWWLFPSFAVAANEDRWHSGGYVTATAFVVLHALAWLSLWETLGCVSAGDWLGPVGTRTLCGAELFVLLVVVIVFGCNAAQAIIALAETIRDEPDRRDLTEALQVFRQFRAGRAWNVDLSNFIGMVSAHPRVYFRVMMLISVLLAADAVFCLLAFSDHAFVWMPLLRDGVALVFTFWLAFWHNAAFQFIERQISKT